MGPELNTAEITTWHGRHRPLSRD